MYVWFVGRSMELIFFESQSFYLYVDALVELDTMAQGYLPYASWFGSFFLILVYL